MSPTIEILETLRDILDLLTVPESPGESPDESPGFECLIVPQPCRVVLSPGLEIPWDECGTGDCGDAPDGPDGQLWANITTMISTPSGGSCEQIVWTADVGIVRCAATVQNDGSPPPVGAVEHDAWQQAADADHIRYAIRCCPVRPDSIKDVELVTWTALGPSGGCVGGAWTIRGILDDCECGPVPEYPRERHC